MQRLSAFGVREAPGRSDLFRFTRRAVVAILSVLAVLAGLLVAQLEPAVADTAPQPPVTVPTVSADALPTVQINGVVFDQAIVGNTVYATGQFSSARPAGSASGSNETARSNILAYSLTTGALITTWAPTLNGGGKAIKASADGKQIFVAGSFTSVSGVTRNRLVALDATSGAVVTSFNPNVNNRVNALAVSGSTVYLGGLFTTVGNQARSRAAAVSATNGAVLPWNPNADAEVLALTAPPGSTKVFAGGRFANIGGASVFGSAALDGTSAASLPWPMGNIAQDYGDNAAIYSLSSDAQHVYGTGYNFGCCGNFEGTFSANVSDGSEVYVTGCYGDTYDSYPVGGVLYSVGHRHDCSSIRGNPELNPRSYQHAMAQTTGAAPSGLVNCDCARGTPFVGQPAPELLHWLPTFTTGTYTGQGQAAWDVVGNSNYVVMGGEFPSVNGTAQQGLVRFAVSSIAPNKQGAQGFPELKPTLLSVTPGRVRISWQASWDRDNRNLTYEVLRGANPATATVLSTQTLDTQWWNRPTMSFQDTTAAPGSNQTYRIRVHDAFNNTVVSSTTAIVVSSGNGTTSTYANAVVADGATHLWRLGEASGASAYDYAGADDLTVDSSSTRGADGAMINDTSAKSTTFSGDANVPATTTNAVNGPGSYSAEAWFKTTSTSGGKIIGFGNNATGTSNSYDHQVYMTNDGKIIFGLYVNGTRTLTSKIPYNDGQWHHVVSNVGASGMELYLDGARIGRDASITEAPSYSGYWRIGGDNLSGWPNQSSNQNFTGSIEEVAIYAAPLTLSQVQSHYSASGRTPPAAPARPTDAYGAAVWDAQPSTYWRLDDAAGSSSAINRMTNEPSGTYNPNGVSKGEPGSYAAPGGTSVRFPGEEYQTLVANDATDNPRTFSLEMWFKTTTQRGGRLIGFGCAQNERSGCYDRHLYMLDDGQLRYGIYDGNLNIVDSPLAYNDGIWHHVVVTQGSTGENLFLDGARVGVNPNNNPQGYSGYWRLGTDNAWGGYSTDSFAGSMDEVAIYDSVLPDSTVSQHYQIGKPPAANQPPTAAFTSTQSNLTASFDATSSTDLDGTVASYRWQFGDGQNGSGASPNHTYAATGAYDVTLIVTDDKGATGTVTKQVSVTEVPNQVPTAAFSVAKAKLKATFDAGASADPDGTIAAYSWDFGDGLSGTGVSPVHTYAAPGTYTVVLTVTDNKGATGLTNNAVTVTGNIKPVAAFGSACTNLACTFDGTQSNDPDDTVIASYAWDFGDGATSTVSKPSHAFATAGAKSVTLVVTDQDGATDTLTNSVTVVAANVSPTAAFTSSCTALACTFDGTTSVDTDGSIASYAWEFGDGITSTVSKPSHTFGTAGDKTVTLTVTDNRGGTGTVSKTITVTAPNAKPTARFTTVCSQLSCTFNAGGSTDTDGSVVSYAWQFGDGRTGAGVTPTHTYVAGAYTVTLTVTDDGGATDTVTDSVSPAPAPNQAPNARFGYSCINLACSFDGTASNDPDGSIVSYAWTFGDGQTGAGPTTNHTYAAAGTFTATLTVTDGDGASNALSHAVTVTAPPPNQNPVASFTSTCTNLACSLDASASSDPDGTIASYAWAFGDGTSGTGKTVSHTFGAAGTFTVTLTVTDNVGATNSITRDVTVTSGRVTLASDAFGRTVSNSWGTADTGGAWTTVGGAAGFAVSGAKATQKISTVSSGLSAFLNSVSSTSTDTTVTAAVDKVATGNGVYVWLSGRKAGNNEYRARARLLSTGGVAVSISRYISGTETLIGTETTVAGLTYTAGTPLKLRLQVDGSGTTNLRFKVWRSDSTEPAAWQKTGTDTTAGFQTAGSVGLATYLSGSSTNAPVVVSFSDLTVATL